MTLPCFIEILTQACQVQPGEAEVRVVFKRWGGVIYLHLIVRKGREDHWVPVRVMPQDWEGDGEDFRWRLQIARGMILLTKGLANQEAERLQTTP